MICTPCKNGNHCMKPSCTCQHKADRPMSAKYAGWKDNTLPITAGIKPKAGESFEG